MGWERTRFLVCAARGEGVRAHQHGVVQRLAVVGVALTGRWLKLGGVHPTPATCQGRNVRSVHGRTRAGRQRRAREATGASWVRGEGDLRSDA